jgi:hypothetical protein
MLILAIIYNFCYLRHYTFLARCVGMNSYRADCVYRSVSMFQFENCWTDIYEIGYGWLCIIGGYTEVKILNFPQVGTTLGPLNIVP